MPADAFLANDSANGLWLAMLEASPVGKSCEALGFPRDPIVVFYNCPGQGGTLTSFALDVLPVGQHIH
jgi:hypothetical protein